MPKREVTPQPVVENDRAVLFVTDTSHLAHGEVQKAPGTLGPLMEYGVLTRVAVDDDGVTAHLSAQHSWIDHGPRIRDAIRDAVDLDGWEIA